MPKLNLTQRINQVFNWLKDNFTTPYPVMLVFPSELIDSSISDSWERSYYAEIKMVDRNLVIYMSKKKCFKNWDTALETLLHEYAHALDWRSSRIQNDRRHHGPEWGLYFAMLYEQFYDLGGSDESKEYGIDF